MLDPDENVVCPRGSVRILNSSLLALVSDATPMMEPAHTVSVMSAKVSKQNKYYLNRTEFQSLASIFLRYKDKLLSHYSVYNPDYVTKLLDAFNEVEAFNAKIAEIIKTLSIGTGSHADFEVIPRPAAS